MFILQDILNESAKKETDEELETLDPIEEAETDDELGGLEAINSELNENCNKLTEALLITDIIGEKLLSESNTSHYQRLCESSAGSFFTKLKEMVKKMYQKVTGFFKNLFRNIGMHVKDVNKILDDNKDELNKNLNGFKYKGHLWKGSNMISAVSELKKMETTANSELEKAKNEVSKKCNIALGQIKKNSYVDPNGFNSYKASEDDVNDYDASQKREDYLKTIFGSDVDNIKTKLMELYCGEDTTVSEIELVNKGPNVNTMVEFVKKFEKNKTLTDLQSKINTIYGKALKSIKDCETSYTKFENSFPAMKDNASDSEKKGYAGAKSAVSGVKRYLSLYQKTLNIALSTSNSIMGAAIDIEKTRYSEHKSTLFAVIRFKPKNK